MPVRLTAYVLFVVSTAGLARAGDIRVRSITATSTLQPEKKKYLPGFILDGTLEKSWVEGAKDDGVGQRITIELTENLVIDEIEIRNGFGKKKYWAKNNRVKKLRVSSVQGKQRFEVELKDTFDPQPIRFPTGWRSNVLTLEILSVYRGTKWRDTAIAEIRIPGVGTYDTTGPDPANIIGDWYHEGERTTYSFGEDGSCSISTKDIDPESEEEVEYNDPCQYKVDGTAITVSLEGRKLELVYKKEGMLHRLWTKDGGFVAQREE